jgi:transcriptional regulator with XRE-family HTH domain
MYWRRLLTAQTTAPQVRDSHPGRIFRRARLVQDRRLREVAAAARVSESLLSMVERGQRSLSPELHDRLVEILFGEPRP